MVDFRYADVYNLEDLRKIMAILRSPDGCPWDREQTHASIRRNMIEEAYEAAEAIDEGDAAHMKEELGDVLLQVVFHACMAEEQGLFSLDDVIDGISKKLVFRHPHVFGTVQADDTEQAHQTWDSRKQEEKGQKTATDTLNAVARSLPALMRAEKIQAKANKAGFDWPTAEPALDKIGEELLELRQAVEQGTNIEEELGDLLFATVKAGRFFDVQAEETLHKTCEKFIRRFAAVESAAEAPMTETPLVELERLWAEAKKQEKNL